MLLFAKRVVTINQLSHVPLTLQIFIHNTCTYTYTDNKSSFKMKESSHLTKCEHVHLLRSLFAIGTNSALFLSTLSGTRIALHWHTVSELNFRLNESVSQAYLRDPDCRLRAVLSFSSGEPPKNTDARCLSVV
jgi:hypothetical protein